MTRDVWLAILSSSLISGILGAVIGGWFNLRSKHNEYANTYYKMVLEKRLKAYEAVERLISQIKIAVVDKDNRPYHILFSTDDDHVGVYKAIMDGMPDALWLSDDLFDATRELNLLVYSGAPEGARLIEFGKTHYREIAELRTKIEKLHIHDMTTLHDVPEFLRRSGLAIRMHLSNVGPNPLVTGNPTAGFAGRGLPVTSNDRADSASLRRSSPR